MKSIRVYEHGEPDVMKLEEVEKPSVGDRQILIKVKAAGVNPVDTYIRAGKYPFDALPYTPGLDASGVIEEIGSGVSGFKEGDRVYVSGSLTGTYAEYILCDKGQVWPLPSNVGFSEGAGIRVPYGSAYRALWVKAHAIPGQTVLVHGASGGVGIAAVQIARAAGFTVIGTAGTQAGLDLVKEQGAHYVFDHNDPDIVAKVLDLTNKEGAHIILEMLANANLDKDLDMVAKFGKIVVIGNRGTIEIDPRKTMAKEASVIGMLLFHNTMAEMHTAHSAICAGLEKGFLKPIVRCELPLEKAAESHEMVMSPGALGKIVLVP